MRKVSIWRFLFLEALYTCFSGLVHPITPTVFNNLNFPDYVYGIVFASMSLGMFLFGPFWGKLGDRIGHSRTFAIALPIYAISQMAFGMARTPIAAIIARFFSGVTGGGAVVASMAYIINATNSENRGRIMAYYAAINSLSRALGFFVGGVVGTISIPMVFYIQAICLLLGAAMTVIFVKDPESYEAEFISKASINPLSTFIDMKGFMTKPLVIFLFTVLIATVASTTYDNSFNYFINKDLKLSSTYNGTIKAITGIIGLVANLTINIYITKKTNMRKSIIYIFVLCGFFAFASPFMTTINSFFAMGILFYLFNTIYLPIQQVLIVSDFNKQSSGTMAGIFNSVRSVGMIFGSLLQGFLYSIQSKLPFVVSSIIFAMSAFVCIIYYRQGNVLKHRQG